MTNFVVSVVFFELLVIKETTSWSEHLRSFISITIDSTTKTYINFSIGNFPIYVFGHKHFWCNCHYFRVIGPKVIKEQLLVSMIESLFRYISGTIKNLVKIYINFSMENILGYIFDHIHFWPYCRSFRVTEQKIRSGTSFNLVRPDFQLSIFATVDFRAKFYMIFFVEKLSSYIFGHKYLRHNCRSFRVTSRKVI